MSCPRRTMLQILKSIWALNAPDKTRQALLSQETQKRVSQYLKA
ncbi:hypothetical protein [Gallaecimonas mangrovi]|nr:hypothetical protein [Gallaecimonas mangrovi]